jgi:3-oxoacyl-[acyl-carrier-protein] synthase-3
MGGIVDFEVRFPSSRATVQEMHEASGLNVGQILEITHCAEFPVLGDREQAWELTAEAARAVIRRTHVPAEAIRQVIYAGSGEWDIPFWSPAARVAAELGIDRAHCFEVANFCNASMTAVRIALDGIAASRSGYALVLAGDRLSQMVDYGDPDSKALFNFGDAAAAILLAREGSMFDVLHSAMRTDPSWSDYYSGELWDDRVIMRRRGRREGLAAAYVENFTSLIHDTLRALDRNLTDVAYFLMNQGDRGMHERLLQTMGFPATKSLFHYDRLGHMGSVDTLIGLQELMAGGKLQQGDLILLGTSAMGFSWGITALEYLG